METQASQKGQQALNDIKASLGSAVSAAKAGFDGLKDKAQSMNQQKMETDPSYKAKVEKAQDFFDKVKDKTADLLRAGADGARNLADKIN